MNSIFIDDLVPGMRFDASLHLGGGELVLYRGQATDEISIEVLKRASVSRVYLCDDDGEVTELILASGIRPTSLEDLQAGQRMHWGLYAANGRKLVSAGHTLREHRLHALAAAGADIVFEPATDEASRAIRKRRFLARSRAPRKGWGEQRTRAMLPSTGALDITAGRRVVPASRPAASAGLSYAFLASDTEDLMGQVAVGLTLDVPRAIEAARSAIDAVFRAPHEMVTGALGALASGTLRDHATASGVVTAAACRELGIGHDDCLEVVSAALLHDIAMTWIKDDLVATAGPLSAAGRRAVRRHPVRAFHTLVDADGTALSTALAVLGVHERSDGTGYPFGLTAGETPPATRLLGAVDVLCAILAPRPHRGPMHGRAAMELCVRMAGEGALDGAAVRALLRAVGLFPVGSPVWLSTGELAVVVATNGDSYERPVVRVIRGTSGLAPQEDRIIDLSRLTGISIARAADAAER